MILNNNNNLFPKGIILPDSLSKNFKSQAYLSQLINEGVNIFNVTFEPGCRNNWRIHHRGGQILFEITGHGYYLAWGETAQLLSPRDVVNIPAGIKRWQGATNDSEFSHLAIEVPALDSSVEWLEEVTDKFYKNIK